MRQIGNALVAMATGVIVFLLFFFVLRGITFLGDASVRSLDLSQRLWAGLEDPGPSVPPFLFVDIDRRVFAEMGYPAVIPRDELAGAARVIVEGDPALLFIDVDLGWNAPDEATRAFGVFLESAAKSDTQVLLLRNGVTAPEAGSPPVFRPTPFDDIVSRFGNLHWVVAETLVSGDGIARHAPLYKAGCYRGKPLVVPGASFLAFALLAGSGSDTAKSLEAAMAGAERPCTADDESQSGNPTRSEAVPVRIGRSEFALSSDLSHHRINYTMRWPLPGGQKRPAVTVGQTSVPVLSTISARHLIERPDDVSRRLFKGRAVIIGSSAPDARDLHLVPLGGLMPGAVIVANHIRSLLEHGVHERYGFRWALILTAIFSLVTFLAWSLTRGFLRRHPVLGSELFKVGAVIFWLAAIVYLVTPAVAIGFVVVQYFVAAVLTILNLYERRTSSE